MPNYHPLHDNDLGITYLTMKIMEFLIAKIFLDTMGNAKVKLRKLACALIVLMQYRVIYIMIYGIQLSRLLQV